MSLSNSSPVFADAIKVATRGNHTKHRVGAVVYDRKGNIIAVGWSHRSQERLAATPRSTHAEHMALRRVPRGSQPHRIVIATVNKNGCVTCGKPCEACRRLIEKFGLLVEHTAYMN